MTAGLLGSISLSGNAAAQEVPGCGNLQNAYGPLDYRTLTPSEKSLVENAHFTPQVEALERGQSSTMGGDLDYTLRAIPNHARALLALSRLGEKLKTVKPPGTNWTIDCYFQRAIAFRPDDPAVHMLYGYYVLREGEKSKAIAELEKARSMSANDPNVHYNLGLAYLQVGRVDEAVQEAKVAYGLGFPLPGLRDKLRKIGRWPD